MLANLARQFFAIFFFNFTFASFFYWLIFRCLFFAIFFIFVVCRMFFGYCFLIIFFASFLPVFFFIFGLSVFFSQFTFFGQFFIRLDLAQRVFRRIFVFTSIRQFFAIFFLFDFASFIFWRFLAF